jgi:AcrR family transcriptional regulator
MAARPPGRPRDPAIDEAILSAAREVLLAVGYTGLSIGAVAARAKVGKPSLYRRYPSKAVLVFEAIFGQTKTRPMPDTGNLIDDLREAYSWAVEEFAGPEAQAAIPGLLADIAANAELASFVRKSVIEPEYLRVRAILERGQQRNEIAPDADLTLAIDAFTGTALARVALLDHPIDRAFGNALVDLLVHGLAPRDIKSAGGQHPQREPYDTEGS